MRWEIGRQKRFMQQQIPHKTATGAAAVSAPNLMACRCERSKEEPRERQHADLPGQRAIEKTLGRISADDLRRAHDGADLDVDWTATEIGDPVAMSATECHGVMLERPYRRFRSSRCTAAAESAMAM